MNNRKLQLNISKQITIRPTILNLLFITFLITFLICQQANVYAATASADNFVNALIGQHNALKNELTNNQFNRPLVLYSTESPDSLKGEIYAVLDYPFKKVNSAINNPKHWCDALILHINVKYCRAENNANSGNNSTVLNINLGKKYDQPLVDTYKAEFNYDSVTNAADYFSIELKAADGPLGTKDYRIWLEATPLNNDQTFLHFTYAYSFGISGRLAMKGYLATIGKDKVGFSILSTQNGKPEYVQGVRGVVERNTMRYYLAIDAYLSVATTANTDTENTQLQRRLENWFDSTERYATQLHEIEKIDYLKMKRSEIERQKIAK